MQTETVCAVKTNLACYTRLNFGTLLVKVSDPLSSSKAISLADMSSGEGIAS